MRLSLVVYIVMVLLVSEVIMENEVKNWMVEYDHKDGRSGVIHVTTEIKDSGAFQYGNQKAGAITIGGESRYYDLRYEHGDLHKLMIEDWFGKGLVKIEEME